DQVAVLRHPLGFTRYRFHNDGGKWPRDETPGDLLAVATSPDGAVTIVAYTVPIGVAKLQFWYNDGKDRGLAKTPPGRHNRHVYALAFPTDDTLLSGGDKGEILIWDLKTGQQTPSPGFPLGRVRSLDMSGDRRY